MFFLGDIAARYSLFLSSNCMSSTFTFYEIKSILRAAGHRRFASVCCATGTPSSNRYIFSTLGDKGASAAIDGLCKGTLLESRNGSQVAAFPPALEEAIKIDGKIDRIEKVDKKLFGDSFVRIRMISYHNLGGAPLFWEFMFFKAKDEWQIYIFRFNDEIDKAFSGS